MIPLGYTTIPEALHVLGLVFGDDWMCGEEPAAQRWLEAAILDGNLQIFVQRGRQYDVEICRVPYEDVKVLGDHWPEWFTDGCVPRFHVKTDTEHQAEFKAWLSNPSGPMPWRASTPAAAVLEKYERQRLLIADEQMTRWLAHMRESFGITPEKAVPKSGAPGRPSSMHIVLDEFERRHACNQCEASREAEAKALAEWLKKTHPNAPQPTPKTIQNRLPAEFQPRTNRVTK